MGLPKININFFGLLPQKPKRSPEGTVALILEDDSQIEEFVVYGKDDEVKGWSPENEGYIKLAFEGNPKEVVVVSVSEQDGGYSTALDKLRNARFNYLAIPNIDELETDEVVDWIKQRRKRDKKTFKAVLPNTEANHESIINFTTEDIVVGEDTYSTAEYTARIAGILAGLPFTRSSTYYVLEEVDSVKEIDNPDEAVNNGELILINDGEKIKVGRGVNSLVSIQPEDRKNDEFKSIRVMEILDMIHDEIYKNFNDHYVGKIPNRLDNQILFINEINKGFNELEGLELLSDAYENSAWIDVEAQRQAWENAGVDTSDWDDDEVRSKPFRRNVFLAGKIKVVETTEDLDFNIEI